MGTSAEALHLIRMPGEYGPIVRCYGELSAATTGLLYQELAFLGSLGHPVITVNLAGCGYLDSEGILAILQTSKRLRQTGQRMMVVARSGRFAQLLQVVGFDRVVPTFPTEEAAMLALRGWPNLAAPKTWGDARAETIVAWRVIAEAIDQAPRGETVLRLLTSFTPLCERSKAIFQESAASGTTHCQFCPLYEALGGRLQDIGCRSLRDPIIEAVRANDLDLARAQVAEVIRTLEELPLPMDDEVMR
jgi:anti-anti-sigma factor